jgi:PAS domain S-box-containing protein
MEFVRPDGVRVPVMLSFVLLDRTAGEAVAFALDLSGLKRSVVAQRESEAIARLFIERAPAAIAMFDTGMRYLGASRRFLDDFGLDAAGPEALVGRSHYEVFPDLPEECHAAIRRVLDGETLSGLDNRFPSGPGRTDWVRWEMTPWRRQDGGMGGVLLFTEVVTARMEAKAALAASEERLRLAVEGIGLASWDMMLGSEEVLWSANHFRMFGYPVEPSGRATVSMWLDRIHPDDLPAIRREWQRGETGDGTFRGTYRIILPDGTQRWKAMAASWTSTAAAAASWGWSRTSPPSAPPRPPSPRPRSACGWRWMAPRKGCGTGTCRAARSGSAKTGWPCSATGRAN